MEKNEKFNKKLFFDHLWITFIIMGVCWGMCVICGINGITKESHAWINAPYILGGFSTTIASYIALKKNKAVAGFKDWLKVVFDFKHGFFAYALAILLPILHLILTCMIGGYEKGAPIYMLIPLIPAMIVGGGLEEAGWSIITFPELNKKFNFVISGIITTAIWWIWHLPLFFIPGVHQYQKNYFIFGLFVLGSSFMLACIREVTGSVWLCMLCHSIVNALPEVFRYDPLGSSVANVITAAVMILVSLIIVRLCKTTNIFK